MKETIKRYIKPWMLGSFIFLCTIPTVSAMCKCIDYCNSLEEIEVPGTLIAKEAIGARYSEWYMAVKPDNPKYKYYSVSVNFATYASFKVNDKISFCIEKSKVINDKSIFKTDVITLIGGFVFSLIFTFEIVIGLHLINYGNKWN